MQQPAQIIKLDEAMQYAGKRFLTMVSGSNATDSELSSFPADLRQHLTELNLTLEPETGNMRHLHALGMLTALRKLELGYDVRDDWSQGYYDLAGQKLLSGSFHTSSLCACSLSSRVGLSCHAPSWQRQNPPRRCVWMLRWSMMP